MSGEPLILRVISIAATAIQIATVVIVRSVSLRITQSPPLNDKVQRAGPLGRAMIAEKPTQWAASTPATGLGGVLSVSVVVRAVPLLGHVPTLPPVLDQLDDQLQCPERAEQTSGSRWRSATWWRCWTAWDLAGSSAPGGKRVVHGVALLCVVTCTVMSGGVGRQGRGGRRLTGAGQGVALERAGASSQARLTIPAAAPKRRKGGRHDRCPRRPGVPLGDLDTCRVEEVVGPSSIIAWFR